ncbi:hypothetical protein D4A92_19890 [Rhizobium rosettiformans]|uniref:Uncharacterized protein n=1 Tax=Rhizobium rosettiformans TaxID=1368430 RepID=A0ABX7EZ08_9HYPH|nr:hypothetical protein [Rhizobium rosettiformans]QRF53549.1 hypothetical protein D4A92_19890 [Rhizobium rosettiformans]
MIDVCDQEAIYEATVQVCLVAVQEGFPHLTIRDIIDPPHDWFDAALARQIVMHLIIREFSWPKRRVVAMEERSREAINRALRTIDQRMRNDRFAGHYLDMAERAQTLLHGLIHGTSSIDYSEVA